LFWWSISTLDNVEYLIAFRGRCVQQKPVWRWPCLCWRSWFDFGGNFVVPWTSQYPPCLGSQLIGSWMLSSWSWIANRGGSGWSNSLWSQQWLWWVTNLYLTS
jgi:hypothetical protein